MLLGLLSETLSPESSLMGSVPAKPTRDFWWATAQIADFGHQLRAHRLADAGHGHDGIVFRELGGQAIHLGTVSLHRAGDGVEL